ncbi:MAG: hypothetical protein AAF602_27845 [Myxococcota bacterium]
MAESTNLRIEGPLERWGTEVAVVSPPQSDERLAMVFGPPVMDPAAVAEAVQRARRFVGIQVPGLLPLRRVEQVKGRLGYGYDVPAGASLVALTKHRRAVPPAAAAGVLAAIGQTACHLGPHALYHPGPTKHDVLVERSGRVWLAGLAGPRRTDAQHADEASFVRQLGWLLTEMLSGKETPPAPPPQTCEAIVQQLFETMSSRGWRLEPAYRRLIRALLVWPCDRRPGLAVVVETARALAVAPDGEPVDRWVRHTWRLLGADPADVPPPPPSLDPFVPDPDAVDRPTQPTEDSEPDFDEDVIDEDTALSEHPAPPAMLVEQGTIPVGVGPPPEAIRRSKVPYDLFGRGITNQLHDRASATVAFPPALAVTAGVLLVVAIALALALLFSPA